jgi:hypothetical protein
MDSLQSTARKFKYRCAICFRRYNHIHHIVPKSLGGTNEEENLIPLCSKHHFQIHVRGASRFMGELQRIRTERLKWLHGSQTIINTSSSFSGTTMDDQAQND